MFGDSITGTVCICVNSDKCTVIGQVVNVDFNSRSIELKDARLLLFSSDDIDINELVSAGVSITAFKNICKTMTVPIEHFAFTNVSYVFSVATEIKQLYLAATKNDKASFKSANIKPSWAMSSPAF